MRAARALALGATCGFAAACVERPRPATAPEAELAPAVDRPAHVRAERWPHYWEALHWPAVAQASPALGHPAAAGLRLRVRVEPSALSAYAALAAEAPLPNGSRLAAFHESPEGELRSVYVLEREAAGWHALELAPDGTIVASGATRCLRCHAMAPYDGVFGVSGGVEGESRTALPR